MTLVSKHSAGEPAWGAPLPRGTDRWAMLLDIDGTLLAFRAHPHDVVADRGLCRLLDRLAKRCDGALALVSGRTIADVDRIFAGRTFPVAGQHGLERRDASGRVHRHDGVEGGLDEAFATLEEFEASHPGVLLERKSAGAVVHFRMAPHLEAEAVALVDRVAAKLGPRFEVLGGSMVLELRPAGRDKGTAIAEFLDEPPFRGRTPVFVGDDRTDEFGFACVERHGGVTVKVGPGPTAATHRLRDARAVRRWLGRVERTLGA